MPQLAHSEALVVKELPVSEKFHFGVQGEGNDVLARVEWMGGMGGWDCKGLGGGCGRNAMKVSEQVGCGYD